MLRVLHIVPRVPPAVCGVGDYAWNIARGLKRDHDMTSTFIAAGVSGHVAPENPEFRVVRAECGEPLLRALVTEAPHHDVVLLQLSGYGFAKRGAPVALARAVTTFQRSERSLPLVTMFHELYASGPIHTSAFWLKPVQKLALRMIARASTTVRTNRHQYAIWLAAQRGEDIRFIPALPIFSSLGEAASFRPHGERKKHLLLFQPPGDAEFWNAVTTIRRARDTSGIIAAGRVGAIPPEHRVEQLGYVTAEAAGILLNDSALGLLAYYDGYLSKSSLFAAYAAHGITTVLAAVNHSENDGIRHGVHYLTPDQLNRPASELEESGRSLFAWYHSHSLSATVTSFATQLQSACTSRC
jgi:hypothetical protein